MRIYVVVPEKIFSDSLAQKKLREKFCTSLKKYYGKFAEADIGFFKSSDDKSIVYIMNESPSYLDSKIICTVRELTGMDSDVKLNYGRISPNFPNEILSVPSPVDKPEAQGGEIEKLSQNYHAVSARYTFEQVILPKKLIERIKEAADTVSPYARKIVFENWGLKNMVPNVASAMNFYGPPGTGKTMAAEAVANYLGSKIIRASYADIESKYHGEGPKMLKAIFMAAAREDAILFIDESDSLLSKRLTNVTDGSAQAINSMRSQLLILLEQFDGVVIFATNLITNYDRAFISRIISIEFPMPNLEARESIWNQHLHYKGINIPVHDIDIKILAEKYDFFCGREIRKAVIYACVAAAMKAKRGNLDIDDVKITQEDFINACEKVIEESEEKISKASDYTNIGKIFTESEQQDLKDVMQKKIDEMKNK